MTAAVEPVAGVDGCRSGWLRIGRSGGALRSDVLQDYPVLFAPDFAAIAIDIPIGLVDRGVRECDARAKAMLGGRHACVFHTPVRRAVYAATFREACDLNHEASGRRISIQAWNICRRIRGVDEFLLARPELRERVREVHPEITFLHWTGAVLPSTATREGIAARQALIAAHFGATAFDEVRGAHRAKDVAHDDICDAFAALWSAERIARGEARTVGRAAEGGPTIAW